MINEFFARILKKILRIYKLRHFLSLYTSKVWSLLSLRRRRLPRTSNSALSHRRRALSGGSLEGPPSSRLPFFSVFLSLNQPKLPPSSVLLFGIGPCYGGVRPRWSFSSQRRLPPGVGVSSVHSPRSRWLCLGVVRLSRRRELFGVDRTSVVWCLPGIFPPRSRRRALGPPSCCGSSFSTRSRSKTGNILPPASFCD